MLELDHIKIRSNILLRTIGIDQFVDSSKPRYFPRFLYKVSNSYFIRTGDYSHAFLLELSDKLTALFGRRTPGAPISYKLESHKSQIRNREGTTSPATSYKKGRKNMLMKKKTI